MPGRTQDPHARPSLIRIASVVEGEGEVGAVPVLLRRIARNAGIPVLTMLRPVLASRGDFQDRSIVERLVGAAAISIENRGGIFLLFDSDGVCPAKHSREVLGWAVKAATGLPVAVVLAHREYEAWLLAGATTLGDVAGLRRGLDAPANPESITDPKVWLSNHMTGRDRYSPTRHQKLLTERFDLREAQERSRSFEKCCREIRRLVTILTRKM